MAGNDLEATVNRTRESSNGTVVRSFVYDPHENVCVLRAARTGQSDLLDMQADFHGVLRDAASGLHHTPNRDYPTALRTWVEQDPVGYVDGANQFQFERSNAVGLIDPLGTYPKVTSITVGALAGEASATREFLKVFWNSIEITGTDLKEAEYTQFVTSSVTVYKPKDLNAKDDQALIEQYIKLRNIGGQIPPFANNVKDAGWGDGDAWLQFDSDTSAYPHDQHTLYALYDPGDDGNQYWQFARKLDFVIEVRCKKDNQIIGKHEWGYTYQNFSSKDEYPIKDDSGAGLYDWYGINAMPQSIDKGARKPSTQPATRPTTSSGQ
jgi:RHS repeat-associated protein